MKKFRFKPNVGIKTLIFSIVCAALIALDLVTKFLEEEQCWQAVIIPNFIEISNNVRNPGCAFSFLNDSPYGQPVLITLTMIMLPVLIAAMVLVPERFTLIKLAVSLVIAGAIGNLVDRFAFHEVRDFFGINMLFTDGLVYCNFADFFIVIGAIVVIVDLLFVNEYCLLPLTKKAREAQRLRDKKSDGENNPQEEPVAPESLNVGENSTAPENAEEVDNIPASDGGGENKEGEKSDDGN